MAAAFFRSVCPGAALTIRDELANVIVLSWPVSLVITTEFSLMDLTVPVAFAAGACARATAQSDSHAASVDTAKVLCGAGSWEGIRTLCLLNHEQRTVQ